MSHEHLGCACCNLPHLPAWTAGLLPDTAAGGELDAAFQQAYSRHARTLAPQATIFHNGVIHTMASGGSKRVEAVGIAGGTIMATGTLHDVRQAMQAHALREVDLDGRTLLPGFVEPHMHVLPSALYRSWLPLTPFQQPPRQQELDPEYSFHSISRQIGKALDQPDTLPKDKGGKPWVLGFGVDPSLMLDWEDITVTQLDPLSSTVPILLMNSSGHLAYLNTAALNAAGITDTPSGVLTEINIAKALQAAPQPRLLEFVASLKQVLDNASAMGLTTVFDAGLGATEHPQLEIGLLKLAALLGPVRIGAALFTKPEEQALDEWLQHYTPDLDSHGDQRFSIKAIKLIADGSNQGLTGYQNEPYACAHEHSVPGVPDTGLSNYPVTSVFTSMLDKAVGHGWPVLVHANGDKAVDYVLDSYRQVLTPRPGILSEEEAQKRRQLRLRVEHASLLDDAAIDKMAELQLNPSFLIGHVGYWGHTFQRTIFGQERVQMLDRCQSALNAGMRISLHSDHFVSPLGPLRMMEQAVFRTMEAAPGKEVLNQDECLSRMAALRAVTLDAAWHCHLDHLVGSLEAGKRADLVILAQDPLDESVRKLRDIAVEETWLAGVKVHGNNKSSGAMAQ
ncbi:amidohydrolase [Janthinobacterium sp. FW305-129]|uniref:amidohydrolase n=1 Tax=Janthinobacterium sp. FW305-129 TaxID=2775054 RepID=UPI001E4E25E9|nr:amidohydrolase family protein [Janthinobacterium sp. FW305-129]MCC7596116.1 amidohydrolase [Janthinobacterium sp. FW305-129]